MEKNRVAIKEIESELERLWEQMPGADKVKAALFTLIVYVEDPQELEHTQALLRHILGRYPCRVLLLKEVEQGEIEVTVSLEFVGEGEKRVTCDQIELTFPKDRREEIPFILLPHLLPNVPVCLLWKGKPTMGHPLYRMLKGVIDRLVIDPVSIEQAENIQQLWAEGAMEITDLKWASMRGWRRILAKVLREGGGDQQNLSQMEMQVANSSPEEEPVSALYLKAWLAARLGWTEGVSLTSTSDSPFTYGTLLQIELTTTENLHFRLTLEPSGEAVHVDGASPTWCEVPCSHFLGPFRREEIFARELFREELQSHYPEMLEQLACLTSAL